MHVEGVVTWIERFISDHTDNEDNPDDVLGRRELRIAAVAIAQFARRYAEIERQRAEAASAGRPALDRLIEVARGDTGQSVVCRRFLLGLYNGHAWPFDLNDLRGLDADLIDAALAVTRADALLAWPSEIHVVAGAQELFEQWRREAIEARDA